MKEMFLLGAGASVEAGIPNSNDMTKWMLEAFQTKPEKYARVVSFVTGGLLFQNGIKGLNPITSGVNVEELFNAIDLLANRHTLEAAPFVGSWHSMIDEFDRITPPQSNAYGLHRAIYASVTKEILNALPNSAPPFGDSEIERALQHAITQANNSHSSSSYMFREASRAIGQYVVKFTNNWMQKLRRSPMPSTDVERAFKDATNRISKPGQGQIFDNVAEYMIRSLANIVWIDNVEKVQYLAPLLDSLRDEQKLTIATLNYDNTIELLTNSKQIFYSTGLESWLNTGSFGKIDNGVLLLKLHGSIDWELKDGSCDEKRPLPYKTIERVSEEQVKKAGFRPAVIFGHKNKLTANGPFLEILQTFQKELDSADRLTIIGYSFGDNHINIYISNWLNQNQNHTIRVIDPYFDKNSNKFVRQLRQIKPQRLEVIEKNASEGLKMLSPTTNES